MFKIQNEYLKKYLVLLVSSLAAGIFIGLGGLLYIVARTYVATINVDLSYLLGAVLFSIGLLLVCVLGAKLYTGQIGFVIPNAHKFLALDLIIMLLMNLLGASLVGLLSYPIFYNNDAFMSIATNVASSRYIFYFDNQSLGETWYKAFISALFCGFFVFMAVYLYRKFDKWFPKIFFIVFCVTAFVYLGMEHCIANAFYFALTLFAGDALAITCNLLLVILGNSIGSILTYLLVKPLEICLKVK